jgi:DNA gyrase inhibitor GyrI
MTQVRTRTLRPMTIAFIEERGPFGSLPFGRDFERLYAWAKDHKVRPGMRPLAVYLDDPSRTPAEDLRTQIAIPVHGHPHPDHEVDVRTLPPMQVAEAKHHGTAAEYPATYAAIAAWTAEHGLEVAGAPMETYTRPPHEVGGKVVITCKVQVPVRPKAHA